ncbi:hypothetical protein EV126DRAFT_19961 [Verticillium dahliae]|nr:hypothetical protein EV126DRAFT_19961 [Verticillium dahliae]
MYSILNVPKSYKVIKLSSSKPSSTESTERQTNEEAKTCAYRMCRITETTMGCGHILKSTSICKKTSRCKTQRVTKNCINDTCAPCDQGALKHWTKVSYESRHELLMTQYIHAKRTGNQEDMTRLEHLMMELPRHVRATNAALCQHRKGSDVLWTKSM